MSVIARAQESHVCCVARVGPDESARVHRAKQGLPALKARSNEPNTNVDSVLLQKRTRRGCLAKRRGSTPSDGGGRKRSRLTLQGEYRWSKQLAPVH